MFRTFRTGTHPLSAPHALSRECAHQRDILQTPPGHLGQLRTITHVTFLPAASVAEMGSVRLLQDPRAGFFLPPDLLCCLSSPDAASVSGVLCLRPSVRVHQPLSADTTRWMRTVRQHAHQPW